MMLSEMKDEDIQGLLVAYLDGELSNDEVVKLEAMLEHNSKLQQDFEIYKTMSRHLEELCQVESISTPKHILERFQVDGSIIDNPFQENKSAIDDKNLWSIFYKPKARAQESVTLTSVRLKKNIDKSGVVDFAVRQNQRRFQGKSVSQVFNLQSLTQMAAALALGVFVGPQIFQVPNSFDGLEDSGAIQLRSGESLALDNHQFSLDLVSLFALSDRGLFDRPIEPGTAIQAGNPFVLKLNAPLNGIVRVYDASRAIEHNALSEEKGRNIYEGDVRAGEQLMLPAKGAFSLTDQAEFTLIVEFRGNNEIHEAILNFLVK